MSKAKPKPVDTGELKHSVTDGCPGKPTPVLTPEDVLAALAPGAEVPLFSPEFVAHAALKIAHDLRWDRRCEHGLPPMVLAESVPGHVTGVTPVRPLCDACVLDAVREFLCTYVARPTKLSTEEKK
jgi:hypothetical protein